VRLNDEHGFGAPLVALAEIAAAVKHRRNSASAMHFVVAPLDADPEGSAAKAIF